MEKKSFIIVGGLCKAMPLALRRLMLFVLCTCGMGSLQAAVCLSDSIRTGNKELCFTDSAKEDNLVDQLVADSSGSDSFLPVVRKKRPWRAAVEVAGINGGILLFDRFVLKGAYSYITLHTIRRNLDFKHWFWDSDRFYTNFAEHPYQGNLFYNAARSNGMNFLESSAYVAAGDLLWEMVGENEWASINDLIATGFGGIAIGEVAHRLSLQIYKPHLSGFKRVLNEICGAVINPVGAFNRILTGEAWTVASHHREDVAGDFHLQVSAGWRHVCVDDSTNSRFNTPYIDLQMQYGDAYAEGGKPYDFFEAGLRLTPGSGQQVFNKMHILGEIYGRLIIDKPYVQAKVGVFQHFNYAFANPVKNGAAAYQISEAASVGPGFMYRAANAVNKSYVEQRLFINAVGLGSLFSDYHDNAVSRNYNIGSGFCVKSRNDFSLSGTVRLRLDGDFYRMFTWLDYSMPVNSKPGHPFSAQGDKNCTSLWIISSKLDISIADDVAIEGFGTWYVRRSNYSFHPNVHTSTMECSVGIVYKM